MFSRCMLPFSVIVVSGALAGWPAAGAEPTNPIPEVARDRYAEAQRLEDDGKLREAVAAYEQAVRLGMQEYPRVYLREAAVYERLGDYEAAAAKYSVVIDVLGLEGSCRDWMRKAYGGRAAAYERQGDYDRAAADYGMIVFSYAVELDIADPKADGYEDLVREAARAYRKRGACLEAKGDKEASDRDQRRADKLDAKAKSAADKARTARAPAGSNGGRVTLTNDWTDTLTIVIGGVPYTLRVGETRTVPSPVGSFPYEIQVGPYRSQGMLDSGRTYSLGVSPPSSP